MVAPEWLINPGDDEVIKREQDDARRLEFVLSRNETRGKTTCFDHTWSRLFVYGYTLPVELEHGEKRKRKGKKKVHCWHGSVDVIHAHVWWTSTTRRTTSDLQPRTSSSSRTPRAQYVDSNPIRYSAFFDSPTAFSDISQKRLAISGSLAWRFQIVATLNVCINVTNHIFRKTRHANHKVNKR